MRRAGALRAAALLVAIVTSVVGAAAQTPATLYGSTADLRFLSVVEARLETKMRSADTPAPGKGVTRIAFQIGADGRLAAAHVVTPSGNRVFDAVAVHALESAAPFPAPPPLLLAKHFLWAAARDPDKGSLRLK